MSDRPAPAFEDLDRPGASPLHGFRGRPAGGRPGAPAALTVAVSRETGARGTDIAPRVGEKLGWQVYSQDLLEYICQEGTFRQGVLDQLTPDSRAWVEEQLERLQREQSLSANPAILDMARTVLCLGAQGEVVLLGRGAGCILPPRSTLHVRLVAPLADRIAYTSQALRLTAEEAAEEVRRRDQRRAELLLTHFHRDPTDVYEYDLILNTGRLSDERCADLIVQAARAKLAALTG